MAYTAIPDTDIDADSPITVALMTALRDNPAAIANGDAGAPKIQAAAIATNAINSASQVAAGVIGKSEIAANACGQSELKTATASQSTSVANGAYGFITPTGGSYTMAWYVGGYHASSSDFNITSHNSTYAAKVGVHNVSGFSRTFYLYSRYVQASPPYDLGNGEIPVFIYAVIARAGNSLGEPAGTILQTSVAHDPAWAYCGPDHINPMKIVTGEDKRQYELVRSLPWTKAEAMADPVKLQDNIAAIANPTYKKKLIDMPRKLRNMPNAPHPFDMTGYKVGDVDVVLLDPLSKLAQAAHELVKDDDHETINEMLAHPSLVISPDPIPGLITPPGVKGVAVTL